MPIGARSRCIYDCGRPAGSREHLFPASCGGLREDKRISCEPCNNQLSPLDTELAAAFASINGLLGVRNRRREEVSSPAVEKRLRRRLSFSRKDGDVRILSPWIREVEVEGGEKVLQICGDDEAVRRAKEYAESQGTELFEARRPHLIVELTYQIRLSNPTLHRAIARLALHYLSTVAPNAARAGGVAVLRRYVRTGPQVEDASPVWLDHDTNTYQAIPQHYRFGHRVALTFSKTEQRIWGHVCLYSCFGYGIDVGSAEVSDDRSYVWDVDPIANREPIDQRAISAPHPIRFERQRPTTRLEADHRIHYLFNEIRKTNWFREAPPLVAAINETRPLSLKESASRIFETLADQRQRLLALATESIRFLEYWLAHSRARAAVERKFRSLISARGSTAWGVARQTWRLVEALRADVANMLAKRLIARPLNARDVAGILVGMEGQEIALWRMARATRCRAEFVDVDEAVSRVGEQNAQVAGKLRQIRSMLSSSRPSATDEKSRQSDPQSPLAPLRRQLGIRRKGRMRP